MLKMKELRKRILSLMLVTSCILSGNPAKAIIPPRGEETESTNQSETSEPKTGRNSLAQEPTDNNEARSPQGTTEQNQPPAQVPNAVRNLPAPQNPPSRIGSQQPNLNNPNLNRLLETELNNLYTWRPYEQFTDPIIKSFAGNINFNVQSNSLHHILHGYEDRSTPYQLTGGHTFEAIKQSGFYGENPSNYENEVREYRAMADGSLKTIFPDTWKLKDLINAIRLTTIENQTEIPKAETNNKGYREIDGYYKGIFIRVVYNQIKDGEGNYTNEYDIITAYPILSGKLRNNRLYAKKAVLDLIKPEEGHDLSIHTQNNQFTCQMINRDYFFKEENFLPLFLQTEITEEKYNNYEEYKKQSLLLDLMKSKNPLKYKAIKTIIENGWGISDVDDDGYTIFHLAAKSLDTITNFDGEDAKKLLNSIKDFSLINSTPKENKGKKKLEKLYQNKSNASSKTNANVKKSPSGRKDIEDNEAPLDVAIKGNNQLLIDFLVENGATIKTTDPTKISADGSFKLLHLAIEKNNDKLATDLIKKGANVNDQNTSLLELSLQKKKYEISKLLVDAGAEFLEEYDGKKILIFCLENKQYKLAESLINKGAEIPEEYDGKKILIFCLENKQYELAESLINKGADVKAENENKDTPLQIATNLGQYKLADLLIKNGADINAQNKDKYTPLHIATNLDQYKLADLLIKNGADINAQDKDENTALILAIKKNKFDIVIQLLEKGANPSINNTSGETLLSIAFPKIKKDANNKTLKKLKKKLIKENAEDINGKTFDDLDKEQETNSPSNPSKAKEVVSQNESSQVETTPSPINTALSDTEIVKNAIETFDENTLNGKVTQESINSIKIDEQSLLDFAISGKYYTAAIWLVSQNFNINYNCNLDIEILNQAVPDERNLIICFAKINNFGLNYQAIKKTDNALHKALINKDYELAQYIIIKVSKEYVNYLDSNGHSPLYIVIVINKYNTSLPKKEKTFMKKIICLLIIQGADVINDCNKIQDLKKICNNPEECCIFVQGQCSEEDFEIKNWAKQKQIEIASK